MTLKSTVFWDVRTYSLVDVYWCFGWTYCPSLGPQTEPSNQQASTNQSERHIENVGSHTGLGWTYFLGPIPLLLLPLLFFVFSENSYKWIYLNHIFHTWFTLIVTCLTSSLTVKKEPVHSSKMSLNFCQARRHHIQKHSSIQIWEPFWSCFRNCVKNVNYE